MGHLTFHIRAQVIATAEGREIVPVNLSHCPCEGAQSIRAVESRGPGGEGGGGGGGACSPKIPTPKRCPFSK